MSHRARYALRALVELTGEDGGQVTADVLERYSLADAAKAGAAKIPGAVYPAAI